MSCSHGRGHTLKSLIQFSVDEWSCVPSLLLTWGQTMVEGDSFKLWQPPSKDTMYVLLHSVPPALWQAPSDPCLPWRLLDTHWQVRVRPLWGHCSFLLGPGVHKVLFVSAKSLFPQSCVCSAGSMVWLMVTSSKRAYAMPRSTALRAPAPAAGRC